MEPRFAILTTMPVTCALEGFIHGPFLRRHGHCFPQCPTWGLQRSSRKADTRPAPLVNIAVVVGGGGGGVVGRSMSVVCRLAEVSIIIFFDKPHGYTQLTG
ncbi:unnamed protein product [Polarella glacialis]|uniref:Uncharacterized protein n=1 Tax=Polarella glacialis TaxID=89957 RepID=A0A813HTE2_POLGL|nr:unnamed protein product [Polarella glacialis]